MLWLFTNRFSQIESAYGGDVRASAPDLSLISWQPSRRLISGRGSLHVIYDHHLHRYFPVLQPEPISDCKALKISGSGFAAESGLDDSEEAIGPSRPNPPA